MELFYSITYQKGVELKTIQNILTITIGLVWLINGLICKVLNIVPRHEQIVAAILGEEYSRVFTVLIGLMEVAMAVWIFTKYRSKLNAIIQTIVIGIMNILEFILVPDLLLWGRLNLVFAILFIGVINYNGFIIDNWEKQQME